MQNGLAILGRQALYQASKAILGEKVLQVIGSNVIGGLVGTEKSDLILDAQTLLVAADGGVDQGLVGGRIGVP